AFVDRSISADLAKQMFPRSEYVRKTPYEDVLRAACAGEADAAFLTVGLYVTLLQQHVDGCESTPLSVIIVPEATIAESVGARQESEAVADEMAAEIGKLGYDGTMTKIGARSGVLVSSEPKLFRSLLAAERRTRTALYAAAVLALVIVIVGW